MFAWLTGCATSTGGGGRTLKETQSDIDWRMGLYRQALTFGQVTLGGQKRVAAAYEAYQTAFHQAVTASNDNLEVPSPPAVIQAANQLIEVLASI